MPKITTERCRAIVERWLKPTGVIFDRSKMIEGPTEENNWLTENNRTELKITEKLPKFQSKLTALFSAVNTIQ